MIKLSEIVKPLHAQLHGDDVEFLTVSFNTRTLQPGELYVALKGENHDGHDFVKQAEELGAVAAIVERPIDGLKIPYLQVKDSLQALTDLADWYWQQKQLPTFALTGSCGKTTVKEMARSILAEVAPVLANQGTLNNQYGVPYTLLSCRPEQRFAVIEMGADHKGEIAGHSKVVRQHVALINNVAPAHLEGFGSLQGIAEAKGEIYQALDKDGVAIINVDDEFANFWLQRLQGQRVITFGLKNKADFTAKNIECDASGCYRFMMITPDGEVEIQLPLSGRHQVMNALAAAAGCWALAHVSLTNILAGLSKLTPVAGRLVPKKTANGAQILDDTYNANLTSVTAALEVLAQCPGEKIFVFGEMRELGTAEQEHHAEVGRRAKQLGIDRLYACGKSTAHTVQAFGDNAQHFATQEELITALKPQVQSTMTLLVKGSRGSRMEKVVAALVE